ncbi:hypothetical protein ABH926_007131 [Catenulispora sp. GP43]
MNCSVGAAPAGGRLPDSDGAGQYGYPSADSSASM